MKTVKSIVDLKRMALERGATVSVGGDRFNTSGVKAALVERKAEPAPAPAPAPTPQATIDMAPVALAQEKMGAMLAHAIASLPQPQSAVREWLFTVERDENGLLTTIRATAQE